MSHLRKGIALTLAVLVSHGCGRDTARSLMGASTASLAGDTSVAARSKALSTPQSPQADEPKVVRKVVHNLNLSLSVREIEPLLKTVENLVRQSGGYIADQSVVHSEGAAQSGTVVMRVPVERFEATSGSLRELGVVLSESAKADDITDQYYDLSARLENSRQFEHRLLVLLKERTGNLADVVAVETKLSEVREQIERLEGKQRLWDNQVALATITLYFTIAPPPQVPKTLVEKLWVTLTGSTQGVLDFGEVILTACVALIPWLPLIAAALWLGRFMLRRRASHVQTS